MGRYVIEYPILNEKLTWGHPLLQLAMLKALKTQESLSEQAYLCCLAQLQLPESYSALKERIAGENHDEADH